VLVCDPRRNALLKEGNKSDRIDARKLADLLRTGMLRPVYHGEHGLRTLRELGRSYRTLSQDLNRVMNRIKALYRGWSIPCAGTQGYAPRYREEWLQKIEHAGVRRGAELLYQQLDGLQGLRRTLRPELLAESRKHKAAKLLRQIPCIGPIRAARLIALMQTPHRFRSKRQLWTYSGLGIETRDSAQYRFVRGQLQRAKKTATDSWSQSESQPRNERDLQGSREHQALDALSYALLKKKVNYVLDADIRGFFDNLDKSWMVKFVEHRVADPRILRLIQKWLNAGVMEEGKWSDTQTGSPQGSVITPLTQKVISSLNE